MKKKPLPTVEEEAARHSRDIRAELRRILRKDDLAWAPLWLTRSDDGNTWSVQEIPDYSKTGYPVTQDG